MVLPRLSSETGSACSVATVAHMPLVQPRSCGEKQLLGRDLSLCFISPTSTENGSELRYRCPVPGCSYIGARVNHAGDCLKHILDSRQMVDEHSRFLVDKLVCFQNADGKPALHSKPVVPSAFSFQLDEEPSSKALAYMKVSTHVLPSLLTRHIVKACCCRLGASAACVPTSPYKHAHAVLKASVQTMRYQRHTMQCTPSAMENAKCSSATSASTTLTGYKPATLMQPA